MKIQIKLKSEIHYAFTQMILHSNLCLDVIFIGGTDIRRIEMRDTSSLVRCSLLAPFCRFLVYLSSLHIKNNKSMMNIIRVGRAAGSNGS